MPSELSSLYKNKPIVLWVEDDLTRTWLHQLWLDADIALLVAAGNDAVHAAAHDARRAGHHNVFGFRDRDFLTSNRSNWLRRTSDTLVFIPEVFEVENYLLDPDGLAALDRSVNRHRRLTQQIEAHIKDAAKESHWWMAVRATLAEVRVIVTDGFPKDPKLKNPSPLHDQAHAEAELAALVDSEWGKKLKKWAPTLDLALLRPILLKHHATLDAALQSGEWRRSWSGKELLNRLKNHLGHTDDDDLAKALAQRHRRSGSTPQELLDLRLALRRRAGLDPWAP